MFGNKSVEKKAYAKINLTLDVEGRREDGYHLVKMVMQSVDIYDVLNIQMQESGISLKSSDPSLKLEMNEDNLIYKAAKLILNHCKVNSGVDITLTKNIPIAAGMAGGSTDAAATLTGINELYNLGLSEKELCELGVKIGADVPFCIMGGTVLAEGIGEILTRLSDVPELILAIAKPSEGISTKYVYTTLDALPEYPHPDVTGQVEAIKNGDKSGIIARLGNSLEAVTLPVCPDTAAIKEVFKNHDCEGTLMSGSGPTVFAVFTDKEKAEAALCEVRAKNLANQTFVTATIRPE